MKTLATIGITTFVLATASAAFAQSLGEVARKEEARRQAIKTPAKVITNDSLRAEPAPPPAPAPSALPNASAPVNQVPPSPSGVQPPAGDKPAAGEKPAAGDKPAADEPKKDEAYWRQRIEAERSALSRAQIFAEALQSRINALTADFTARDDPAQRDGIASDRQKALAELDRVKQEIQQHQKAIAAIQEEARRAGVPAGWVR